MLITLFNFPSFSRVLTSPERRQVEFRNIALAPNSKLQIPLRTRQRPQPILPPNRVCLHFTFSYHVCTHFVWLNFLKNEHYLLTLSVHTLCLYQFCFCTFVLYFNLQDCVHICTVQVYTRWYQPALDFVSQSQKSFDLLALL